MFDPIGYFGKMNWIYVEYAKYGVESVSELLTMVDNDRTQVY